MYRPSQKLLPNAKSVQASAVDATKKRWTGATVWRNRLGIAMKLNLLTVAIILLTASAIGVAVVRIQSLLAFSALRNQGTAVARMLAEGGAIALSNGEQAHLAQLLASLEGNVDVAYAGFFDQSGAPITERVVRAQALNQIQHGGWPASGESIRISNLDSDLLRFAVAIRQYPLFGPNPGATTEPAPAFVGLILSSAHARAEALTFVKETTRLTIVVAALAIVLTLLFTRRLVQPVHELAAMAREVADGQLGQTVPVRSNDEIADLARAFQHMIDKLGASRSRLLEYQNQLENRVQARTRELEQATAQALDLAQRDTLTGLPNRAHFREMLERALDSHRMNDERLALLFLDLDLFKRINDTLGHHAGDALLLRIADTLRQCVRDGDLIARLGGDEFVMLVRNVGSSEQVSAIARRILNAFSVPLDIEGQALNIGFSIGISLCPEHAQDASGLLRSADLAMYSTKEHARGGYRFYTPDLNQRAMERLSIENGLRRALASDTELRLEFQPQVDLASGHLVAVEALLRWHPPVGAPITPNRFIPIAEETGLIMPIGERVLRQACEALARWKSAGLYLPRIAINISAPQFESRNFCNTVARVLADYDIPADLLELELTESLIMRDADAALREMQRLKELGVSIALDDFGTGYSSLAYLSRLPFDIVKIDRSFVMHSTQDRNAHTIIRTIVALSHALGRRVVAEGVETHDQLGLVRASGCDYLQGFLVSRPMPETALISWLASPNDRADAVLCQQEQ